MDAPRSTATPPRQQRAAPLPRQIALEEWFLQRGMPAAAPSASRFPRLLLRAAPVLAGLVTFSLATTVAMLALRAQDPDAPADPDADLPAWYYVAVAVAPLLGIAVGVLANRLARSGRLPDRQATLVSAAMPVLLLLTTALDALLGIADNLALGLVLNGILLLIVLALIRAGAGAIFIWALRQAAGQAMALVPLAARALPMILLVTIFAFLSSGLWEVTGALSRNGLWNVVLLLLAIAGLFAWAVIRDEMRDVMDHPGDEIHARLALQCPPGLLPPEEPVAGQAQALTWRESLNAVALLLIAQVIQIGSLAVLVFVFFCVFGAYTVPPSVVELWTGHPTTPGMLMGMELPVHHELIQTSLFLAAFSTVSFAAASVTDPTYRQRFFDPLLRDVAVTVTARRLCRASTPAGSTGPSAG